MKSTLYLDCCCYNRPYDDMSQPRINYEAEMILSILDLAYNKRIKVCGSELLLLEILKMKDVVKRTRVRRLYSMAEGNILLDKRIEETAEEIRSKSSIKLFDSLHLAAAEVNGIDYFITTDDRFLKQAVRLNLRIQIMSPGEWFEKEGKYYE